MVSTIAIFAPSFAFIMLAALLLLRIRENTWIKAFLKGVTPEVLGAIAAATLPLIQTTLSQPHWIYTLTSRLIGLAALMALLRYKLPTWKLVPLGTGLGLLVGIIPIR